MITKIAQFRVKKEKLSECLNAIKEFVDQVRENEPNTLRYEAFQKQDKVSFIHFMEFKDSQAEVFHRSTPHVQKFVETVYPNCELEPKFDDLGKV